MFNSVLNRFATKTEIFLDIIGLVFAAAAGAAQASLMSLPSITALTLIFQQPLMSLIFGRLTQDFVNFEIARVKAEQGDSEGLGAAASQFRKSAALDASYLVYIGISLALINLPTND